MKYVEVVCKAELCDFIGEGLSSMRKVQGITPEEPLKMDDGSSHEGHPD